MSSVPFAVGHKRKFYAYAKSQVKRARGIRMARAQLANRIPRLPKFPYHFADQPLRKFAKLKYTEHMTLAGPGAAAIVVHEFRANGMYDPRVALGGHQPYGFDQIMAGYHHFTVLKSTFEIENLHPQYADDIVVVPALNTATGTLAAVYAATGANGIKEMPLVGKTLLFNCYGTDTLQSNRISRVQFDAQKLFGKSYWDIIGDSRFQGNDAADPTEDAYFSLGMYCASGVDRSGHSYPLSITITYYAVFTEPRYLTAS